MQKELVKEFNIDRCYFNYTSWDPISEEAGIVMIFPKPYTEVPFEKQKLQRIMKIKEFEEATRWIGRHKQ